MQKNVRKKNFNKNQYIFYSNSKKLNNAHYLTKSSLTDYIPLKSFSFSINNTYALYENQLLTWIPQTQNLYDDNLEYLKSNPISFSNFGLKKIKSISCNTDVCHAITEDGCIFSWGNDIEEKGLLGLGNKIFQVKVPTLNKNLSKLKIQFISLSQSHAAGLDYNNNLYTWGDDSYGQCGLNNNYNKNNNFDEYNNFCCFVPKKIVLNCSFNVKKVQCGKFYTAGINNDGIAFKFGVINYKNYIRKDNNIAFFNFKNNENFVSHFPNLNPEKVNDIFCGEELLCFITQKGEMFIYNEIQGLFKIKLNNESHENSLNYQQRQNNIIDNVKFIDRTFYAISKNNTCIYEFINYSYKNKDFDFNDYVQNEYDINENVKLSMLNQPYYVKVIFFRIKCSDYLFNEFEENEDKIFFKRKYHKESNNLSMTNHNFSNFNHTYDSFNNHNITSMNKITKISNMLNNIFDRKIDNIINKTRVNLNSENTFLSGKKRIELIKINFQNNSGISFLENESISEIKSFNNTFNLSSNILNIPINENYIHEEDRKIKNSVDKERNKFKSKINQILSEDKENNNSNNSRNNLFNKILNDDVLNSSIKKNHEEHNSINVINGRNNTENIINDNDNQIEKIKEKMNKLRKNVIDDFEQRKNDSNKKREILINNLKNIDINDNKGDNGENSKMKLKNRKN